MLLQATDVTEVRSTQLSELTDAAEAEALRLPLTVDGSDGGALDRGDGADSHRQCRCDGAGGCRCRRHRRFELPLPPLLPLLPPPTKVDVDLRC